MIVVRLREMIRAHEAQTGQKLTYALLAEKSGVARATVESLASRSAYNATLATVDKLCDALGCGLHELVEYAPTPRPARSPKKPAQKKPSK